ncbi:MAG TPA: cyclase dehydrase [Hyphomicrobiales bacterium]|nr:cyclase dehydrase [Hyphomicrobiales bacterium]
MIIEAVSKVMDLMPRSRKHSALNLAHRLGWLSIGLGIVEIVACRPLARLLGVRRAAPLINLYGMRGVATGVAILAAKNPTPLVWGRVGGDALDIASIMTAFIFSRNKLGLGLVLTSVAAVTAVDLICAQTLSSDMKRLRSRIPDYSDRSGLPLHRAIVSGGDRRATMPAGASPGVMQ